MSSTVAAASETWVGTDVATPVQWPSLGNIGDTSGWINFPAGRALTLQIEAGGVATSVEVRGRVAPGASERVLRAFVLVEAGTVALVASGLDTTGNQAIRVVQVGPAGAGVHRAFLHMWGG